MDSNRSFVYSSFEELTLSIKRCNVCCKGNYESFHCPLCPTTKIKPTKLQKVKSHLFGRHHWQTNVQDSNGLFSILCQIPHDGEKTKGHFHCSTCSKVFYKKDYIKKHIKKCKDKFTIAPQGSNEKTLKDPHPNESTASEYQNIDHDYHRSSEDGNEKSVEFSKSNDPVIHNNNVSTSEQYVLKKDVHKKPCPICGKFINKRWLKKHIQTHDKKLKDINEQRHYFTVVVSAHEGIFCSTINLHGPASPIHIQKKTSGLCTESFCENKTCIQLKNTARLGNNVSFECNHVRSIPYARPGRECNINMDIVRTLKEDNVIMESRFDDVMSMKEQADLLGSPLCVLIPTDPLASKRYVYLSIFTGKIRYWGRIKRTIVTFDKSNNTIRCRCEKKRRYCIHKVIGKCFLHQDMPELFKNIEEPMSEEEEIQLQTESPELNREVTEVNYVRYPCEPSNLPRTFQYVRSNKTIPEDLSNDLPRIYNNPDFTKSKTLVPSETLCSSCNGDLQEDVVSKRSKIILMDRVIKDVTVFCKLCISCRFLYRYQEWEDGIHNYNDSLLVGMDVFMHLRSGIKNHVAIGRSLLIIQDVLGEEFNILEMEQAYLHFEAMSDRTYSYNCVLCGFHPPIIIWDGFRKAGFRYAVSEIQVPSFENAKEEVDINKFWQRVENSVLARGFSKETGREMEIEPSYEEWSPWIGENSRIGNEVYNTEFKKCVPTNSGEIDDPMSEELLIRLLNDEKVTSVRRICRELGIKPDGSAMDMIIRLREMSITKSAFDKAYEKIFGCSGGWVVGCCQHGIVYCLKSILRCEGARDYIDLERSLKHRPTISICDIAHLIARNGNNTIPNFFYPESGRLAPCTDTNIASAESGEIKYSLPVLLEPSGEFDPSDRNSNPVTGCNIHLALFDWFHQGNCSKREEILRNSSLLSELAGLIDTQVVEHLFSSSKKDIYFLNNMSPGNNLFLTRLIYHLRNKKRNEELLQTQQKTFGDNLEINQFGQLCQQYFPKEYLSHETEIEVEVISDWQEPCPADQPPLIDDGSNSHDGPTVHYTISSDTSKDKTGQSELIHYNEFASLNVMFQSIIEEEHSLSDNEKENLTRNARYANTVLYQSASIARQQEVKSISTPYGHIQTQGASNYCGLCCVNNSLGCTADGNFKVNIKEMDDIADEIWVDMVFNPAMSITELVEPMRDREGYYSLEVIQRVLEKRKLNLVRIDPQNVMAMDPTEAAIYITDQLRTSFGIVNIIIRLKQHQHWIVVKLIEDNFFLFDSLSNKPRILSLQEVGEYILLNVFGPGSVFFLAPDQHMVSSSLRDPGGQASKQVNDQYVDVQEAASSSRQTCQEGQLEFDFGDETAAAEDSNPITSIEEPDNSSEEVMNDETGYNLRPNPSRKRFSENWVTTEAKASKHVDIEQHCIFSLQDELPDLEPPREDIMPIPFKTKAEREEIIRRKREEKRKEALNSLKEIIAKETNVSSEHKLQNFVSQLYDLVNTSVLENKLPNSADCIHWANLINRHQKPRNVLGLTFGDQTNKIVGGILLHDGINDTNTATTILLHEMVHALIFVDGIPEDFPHGQVFRTKANMIVRKVQRIIEITDREELKDIVINAKEIRNAKKSFKI